MEKLQKLKGTCIHYSENKAKNTSKYSIYKLHALIQYRRVIVEQYNYTP
jgi:hypothetical protein